MLKDYVLTSPGSGQTAEEFVASFWDARWRDGQSAQRRSLRKKEEYRFLRSAYPPLETAQADILDCGCGLGTWTLFFTAQGHRAIGLDLAPETVERLRREHGDRFRLGDFRKIDCPDSSFDLVINWGGIEHFEEGPVPAILEARRVLRPGGVFVATTPCHNLRLVLLDTLLGRWTGPGHPFHNHRFYQYRFSRTELEGYFRSCGLVKVRSRIINGAQGVHRSLEHELGWLGSRLPYLVRGGLMWIGGRLLRPFLGHMVICAGMKPIDGA
jgi:SAM-dependent methyltransferase